MPQPIDYATPKINRKSSRFDAIPGTLGALQLLVAACVLNGGQARFDAIQKWYEWPARLFLSDISWGSEWLLCSFVVVIGAIKSSERRRQYYVWYGVFWIVAIALTETSLLVFSPWPGERRFRWVLVHNMRSDLVNPYDFWNYLQGWSLANPALWYLIGRCFFSR